MPLKRPGQRQPRLLNQQEEVPDVCVGDSSTAWPHAGCWAHGHAHGHHHMEGLLTEEGGTTSGGVGGPPLRLAQSPLLRAGKDKNWTRVRFICAIFFSSP